MSTTEVRPVVSATTAKAGAAALVAGTALNMLRMFPILLGDGAEALPSPDGPDEIAGLAANGGWYISHLMAIASVPLLIYGFVHAWQSVRERNRDSLGDRVALAGVFGVATGLALYLVAAVLDGIALARAAEHYEGTVGTEREAAGVVLTAVHETAVSFGGHFMGIALVGTAIFALGVHFLTSAPVFPKVGIALGWLTAPGALSGVLDFSFSRRFPLVMGLVGAMMIWWIALAVFTKRGSLLVGSTVAA